MKANLVNPTRAQRRQQARDANKPTRWQPCSKIDMRRLAVQRTSHALRRAVWNRDLVKAQRYAGKLTSLEASIFDLPSDCEFDDADLFELAFDGVLHVEMILWLVREAVKVGYRAFETFADLLSYLPEEFPNDPRSRQLAVQILKEIYEFELSPGVCASDVFEPPKAYAQTACQIFRIANAQLEAQRVKEILASDTAASEDRNSTKRRI